MKARELEREGRQRRRQKKFSFVRKVKKIKNDYKHQQLIVLIKTWWCKRVETELINTFTRNKNKDNFNHHIM